jgi:hypothetical protein
MATTVSIVHLKTTSTNEFIFVLVVGIFLDTLFEDSPESLAYPDEKPRQLHGLFLVEWLRTGRQMGLPLWQ